MRIMRKQHLILALLAICKNFMYCTASMGIASLSSLKSNSKLSGVPQCKTADDINPPFCKLEQLESEVLLDLCKSVGYNHHIPNPTREETVTIASMCQMMKEEMDNALTYIDDDEKEAARNDMIKTVQSDSSQHYDKYLKSPEYRSLSSNINGNTCYNKDGTQNTTCMSIMITEKLHQDYLEEMEDKSISYNLNGVRTFGNFFRRQSRTDRIAHIMTKNGIDGTKKRAVVRKFLLEKLKEDDVSSLEISKEGKLTPEEIARLPEWKDNELLPEMRKKLSINVFQDDGETIPATWNDKKQRWVKLSASDYKDYRIDADDINEYIRKAIRYEYIVRISWEREQSILVGFNMEDDPIVVAHEVVNEYKLDEKHSTSIANLMQKRIRVSGILPVLISSVNSERERKAVLDVLKFGNDDQIQAVIDAGLATKMDELLSSPDDIMKRDACTMLSIIGRFTMCISSFISPHTLTSIIINMSSGR